VVVVVVVVSATKASSWCIGVVLVVDWGRSKKGW
jgi:hypothetical protein